MKKILSLTWAEINILRALYAWKKQHIAQTRNSALSRSEKSYLLRYLLPPPLQLNWWSLHCFIIFNWIVRLHACHNVIFGCSLNYAFYMRIRQYFTYTEPHILCSLVDFYRTSDVRSNSKITSGGMCGSIVSHI